MGQAVGDFTVGVIEAEDPRTDCTTREEVASYIEGLFPRGRAWQTHDASISRQKSVMKQFIYALAGPLHDFEKAVCNSFDEMFCSTADVNRDAWLSEYG